jgi:1,4-alpha-glucan branching enzyme
VRVFHVHRDNRVLAFHRWIEGLGRDVVVVMSLRESTWWSYSLGFPGGGHWLEVFNSDIYDHWVNPQAAGNGGGIEAQGGAMHGMPASANIVIPANSLLVFARDEGSP